MIRTAEIEVTLDGSGAGSASSGSINGTVLEVRCPGTEHNEAGKCDITVSRAQDGAQLVKVANKDGPWSAAPSQPLVDNENGAALFAAGGTALRTGIPVAGYLNAVVAEGKAGKKLKLIVYYEG